MIRRCLGLGNWGIEDLEIADLEMGEIARGKFDFDINRLKLDNGKWSLQE